MQRTVLMAKSATFSVVADYAKAFCGLAANWTITILSDKPTGHIEPALQHHGRDISVRESTQHSRHTAPKAAKQCREPLPGVLREVWGKEKAFSVKTKFIAERAARQASFG
jgi:hypothetical protein